LVDLIPYVGPKNGVALVSLGLLLMTLIRGSSHKLYFERYLLLHFLSAFPGPELAVDFLAPIFLEGVHRS